MVKQVMENDVPDISWEEHFGVNVGIAVVESIFSVIDARLRSVSAGESRLYLFVPTPAPYDVAEQQFLASIADKNETLRDVHTLTLEPAGKCYATRDEEQFRTMLPQAFLLGPPELTIIIANANFDPVEQMPLLQDNLLGYLERESSFKSEQSDVVGFHFDSGDLVELF